MDTFNFEWKPEYKGTWQSPSFEDEMWGTLKVGQSDIILELICHSCHEIEGSHLESITGRIDSLDANNVLSVMLRNLSLVKMKVSLGEGYNSYKYVAEELFISSEIGTLPLPIKAVRFCSEYIGLWSKGYTKDHIIESFDEHRVNLDYTQPEPYRCFEDDSICVELCYSFGRKTPNHLGYTLRTRNYLDVTFKEPSVDFHTAKTRALQTSYLFSLLIQRPIDFCDIFYITDRGTFIHRNGLRYRNVIIRETPYTSNNFADLTSDNLCSMVPKWHLYYQKYTNSLDTFFEIWNHELLPSEQRFKGYMSVLDGLTSDLPVENNGQTKDSKRVRSINEILLKVSSQESGLSKNEINTLKMAALRESSDSVEMRFCELLNILNGILPDRIDNEYVYMCARTRNKLTHPESEYEEDIFTPSQYPKVVRDLETILCSYMLHCIGLEKVLIKQTLRLNAHETVTL